VQFFSQPVTEYTPAQSYILNDIHGKMFRRHINDRALKNNNFTYHCNCQAVGEPFKNNTLRAECIPSTRARYIKQVRFFSSGSCLSAELFTFWVRGEEFFCLFRTIAFCFWRRVYIIPYAYIYIYKVYIILFTVKSLLCLRNHVFCTHYCQRIASTSKLIRLIFNDDQNRIAIVTYIIMWLDVNGVSLESILSRIRFDRFLSVPMQRVTMDFNRNNSRTYVMNFIFTYERCKQFKYLFACTRKK